MNKNNKNTYHKIYDIDIYGFSFMSGEFDSIKYKKDENKPVVARKGFRARKGEYTENPEDLRTYRNIKRF